MFDRLFARCGRPARARRDAFDIAARIRDLLPAAEYSGSDRRRDFHAVFRATPAGRRVLAQVLQRCRVCAHSYMPGDGLETARREGMRDVGLWLIDILAEDGAELPGSAEADAPGPQSGART